MILRGGGDKQSSRDGVATLELAILAPLLLFLFVLAVDYSRVFYYSMTVMNCARNGALYGSDPTGAANLSPYSSIQQAALADASNLSPQPTITSQTVADGSDNYIEVTATYQFHTLTNYPVIPNTVNLSQTVRMRITQATPSFN